MRRLNIRLSVLFATITPVVALVASLSGCISQGDPPAASAEGAYSASQSEKCDAVKDALTRVYVARLVTAPLSCLDCDNGLFRSNELSNQITSETALAGTATGAPSSIGFDDRGLAYSIANGVLRIDRIGANGDVERVNELSLGVEKAAVFVENNTRHVVVVGQHKLTKASFINSSSANSGGTTTTRLWNSLQHNNGVVELFDIDTSSPVQPLITRQLQLEGTLLGIWRPHDGYQLATRYKFSLPEDVTNDPTVRSLVQQISASLVLADNGAELQRIESDLYRAVADVLSKSDWLKNIPQAVSSTLGVDDGAHPQLTCANIVVPSNASLGRDVVSVTAFARDRDDFQSVGIVGANQSVYGGSESVYVTQPAAVDRATTTIHRVRLDGTQSRFREGTEISGVIRTPTSIDEHDGALRIVTEIAGDGGRHVSITTLSGEGVTEGLRVLGTRIVAEDAGLAAVSFSGNTAYIATRSDSNIVNTVDLSDTRNPAITSRLATNASNDALIALGSDRLLSISRPQSIDEATMQLRIGLIDASNPAQLVERYRSPVSASAASECMFADENCGIVYFSFAGIVALPIDEYNQDKVPLFSGFTVLDVSSSDSFFEVARVDDLTIAAGRSSTMQFGIVQIGQRRFLVRVTQDGLKTTQLNMVGILL